MTDSILMSLSELRTEAKKISKSTIANVSYDDALHLLLSKAYCETEAEYEQRYRVQEAGEKWIPMVDTHIRTKLAQAVSDPAFKLSIGSTILAYAHDTKGQQLLSVLNKDLLGPLIEAIADHPDALLLETVQHVYEPALREFELRLDDYWTKAVFYSVETSFFVGLSIKLDSKSLKRSIREFATDDAEGFAQSPILAKLLDDTVNQVCWFQLP